MGWRHITGLASDRRQRPPLTGVNHEWVLFVVLATSTGSDKAINATPVSMATEQLCNAARTKLVGNLQAKQHSNFVMVIECLQAR